MLNYKDNNCEDIFEKTYLINEYFRLGMSQTL